MKFINEIRNFLSKEIEDKDLSDVETRLEGEELEFSKWADFYIGTTDTHQHYDLIRYVYKQVILSYIPRLAKIQFPFEIWIKTQHKSKESDSYTYDDMARCWRTAIEYQKSKGEKC